MRERTRPLVILAGAHAALARELESEMDVRETRSAHAAKAALARGGAHGVLIDHDLRGDDGLALLLDAHAHDPTLSLALVGRRDLHTIVNRVSVIGALVLSAPLGPAEIAVFASRVRKRHEASLAQIPDVHLSERERVCLERVLARRTYKEVAASLGISVASVRAYLARAIARLGCRSLAEARHRFEPGSA